MISSDEIERCFNAIRASNEIVIDVETSGLDKHRNFICGYVFTVGPAEDQTWYLPIRHQGGMNIPGARIPKDKHDWNPSDVHPLEKRIAEILADPSKHWIGHNIKYDLWMLLRHGMKVAGSVEDTAVNAALIDENQRGFSLENCAKVMGVTPKATDIYPYIASYMAVKGVKCPEGKDAMAHYWEMPADERTCAYARDDGISTWELRQKQLEEIFRSDEKGDTLEQVYKVERRVTRTLFRIESRGVPVDVNRLELVKHKVNAKLTEAMEKLPKGLNVRSSPAVKKFLISQGITDGWPVTEKGNASFPEEYLSTFDVGNDIVAVRKFRNLNSTFIEGSIMGHLWEGKVHCNLNQLKADEYGTVSGRLSSSNPNMQQIPKRDKILAPLLRQLFRDKNRLWFSADYKQQEYKVFAFYARSQAVLEAYRKDPYTDYHQLVADMLGVERDPAAKRINLGTIYNMGAPKLALGLGVPLSVATDYMDRMRRMMPEAKKFNKTAEMVAKKRGYVKTILGRRRRFPNGEFAHKAGNAVIQGSSADITKLKMVEIDEFLESENSNTEMILQVHDSLEFLFDPAEQKIIDEAMRIMQNFSEDQMLYLDVPMTVDIGSGLSWGHATFPKYQEWV